MAFGPAIVMMGVSGSGKSTVGVALAARLGVPFRDADEFHPPSNVEKMAAGIPLNDDDRWPWLDAIGSAIRETPPAKGIVVSCSALKRIYRDRIIKAASRPVSFAHLDGPKAVLAERLKSRKGHFFPPSLLDSQLATLEPLAANEPAISASIELSVEEIVDSIVERLHLEKAAE
jgi:carbohydrate kinase (thermoresistant glucokinase family)